MGVYTNTAPMHQCKYKLQYPRQGSMSTASANTVLSGVLQLTCWISIENELGNLATGMYEPSSTVEADKFPYYLASYMPVA